MFRYLCAFLIISNLIPCTIGISNEETTKLLTNNASITYYNSRHLNETTNKYCQICCIELQAKTVGKKCGAHTLCRFESNNGPACKGFVPVLFTPAEKRLLVDAHNTIRNRVAAGGLLDGAPGPQPPAANMRAVAWDDELAVIADRWAAQCIFAHDICRDLERFPVGQSIARGVLATDDDLTLMQRWHQEARFFNASLVESYRIPTSKENNYAHYSQLVWADTYLIGCARAMFQTSRGAHVAYTSFLVCNYGPTGNIPAQRTYRIGTPCSECHEGTACNSEYEALCAADASDGFNDYLANAVLNEAGVMQSSVALACITLVVVVVVIFVVELN